jgi:hypothetical protein
MADFDRKCSIRERVEANHAIGRPSSEWDTTHTFPNTGGEVTFLGVPTPWSDGKTHDSIIPAISPEEWLLDPSAAR